MASSKDYWLDEKTDSGSITDEPALVAEYGFVALPIMSEFAAVFLVALLASILPIQFDSTSGIPLKNAWKW